MNGFNLSAVRIEEILLWGTIATAAMTSLTEGAQLLGLSRMSLPFLFGTIFTGRRDHATVYGFILYSLGGLAFSFLYAFAFEVVHMSTWWLGALVGLLHGVFLITVILPLMPHVHPRMATEYDGPTAVRRLEPPGPFGLNYGRRTPLAALAGMVVYGTILGAAFQAR